MASIDDLLLSDDSDDEIDSNVDIEAVNLESLLNSNEDDDDDDLDIIGSKRLGKPAKAPGAPTSLAAEESKSRFDDLLNTIRLGTDSADIGDSYKPELALSGEIPETYETTCTVEEGPESEVVVMNDEVESLKLAEQREHRALLSTNKQAPSSLQQRRPNTESSSSVVNLLCLETLPMVSSQLKRNISYQFHGPGSGTAYTLCDKFLAIGTNKGYIIIFDYKQEIRRVLNSSQATQIKSPHVNSLTCLADGTLLVSGHKAGDVLFWDTTKGTVIKQFRDPSGGDVLSVQLIYSASLPDPRVNTTLADCDSYHLLTQANGNTLNRYKMNKSMLGWSMEVDCLLDKHETIKALAVLPPCIESALAPTEFTISDVRFYPTPLQIFAFAVQGMTVIVQVLPEVKILHRWPSSSSAGVSALLSGAAQEGEGEDIILEWNWLFLPDKDSSAPSISLPGTPMNSPPQGSSSGATAGIPVPTLLRYQGGQLEVLSMRVQPFQRPASGQGNAGGGRAGGTRSSLYRLSSLLNSSEEVVIPSPTFQFAVEQSADVRATLMAKDLRAAKWLSAHHLLAFTHTEALLLDERLSLVERAGLPPEIKHEWSAGTNSLLLEKHIFAVDSSEDKPAGEDHKTSEKLITKCFLLCPGDVFIAYTRSPFDSVNALINAGKHIEGLAMIVDTITKSPALLATEGDAVRRYILNYALLAVKQPLIPITGSSANSMSMSKISGESNHLYLVASVCVEYCVKCDMLPLLFDEIMRLFRSEHCGEVLLLALEPYIMSEQIRVPVSIVNEFMQMALTRKRNTTVERCVLHLDLFSLDLNSTVRFLYQLKMYSSFLYLYSQGLGDYRSAAAHVFLATSSTHSNLDGVVEDAEIGYKLLLFLSYSFQDKIFPTARSKAVDVATVMGLLDLLCSPSFVPPPPLVPTTVPLTRHGMLGYLCHVDPQALWAVLSTGLDKAYSLLHSQRMRAAATPQSGPTNANADVQRLGSYLDQALQFACEADEKRKRQGGLGSVPLEHLLWDRCNNVMLTMHSVHHTPSVLRSLVRYYRDRGLSQHTACEAKLKELVEHQCKGTNADTATLLDLFQALVSHQFYNAALATRLPLGVPPPGVDSKAAMSFYLSLPSTFSAAVFDFIAAQFHYLSYHDNLDESQHASLVAMRQTFCRELIDRLLTLASLNTASTVAIVNEYLLDQLAAVIAGSKHDTRIQFQLLRALIDPVRESALQNNAAASETQATQGILANNLLSTPDLLHFLRLYALHAPRDMLSFLERHPSHIPLDECLAIVREHFLYDCVAHFMERCGDVAGALAVLLKDVATKLKSARKEVDAQLRLDAATPSRLPVGSTQKKTPSVKTFLSQVLSRGLPDMATLMATLPCLDPLVHALDCTLALCSRQLALFSSSQHHTTSQVSESQVSTFFGTTFDSLLQERRTLRSGTLSSSSEFLAHLLSHYIKQLIVHMRHIVSSQSIVQQLVEHAESTGLKLAEFRDVFVHMLDSSSQDLLMGKVVNNVVRADFLQVQVKKLQRMRSFVYRSDAAVGTSSGGLSSGPSSPVTPQSAEEIEKAALERRLRRLRNRPTPKLDMRSMKSRHADMLASFIPRTSVETGMGYIRDPSLSDEPSFAGKMNPKAIYTRAIPQGIRWE